MPWSLGEASICWCTRKDLNLHALRRPLLRRLRLPFRHECIDRNDGAATAHRTPVTALPRRCPATGRLRLRELSWCWLDGSNLPPLAYKASSLPDELSQPGKIDKKDRGTASDTEATLFERAGVRRRVQFWTFTMSKSAAPPAPLVKRERNQCIEHARTRASPKGTGVVFGCSVGSCAGHLPLLPVRRRGEALRRLFRFRYRALSGPTTRFGGSQIRHANAYDPPIARSIGPCGGGAERGGDM
jgi:hypothetical protein